MYINIIEAYRRVIAVADEDLIGKKFFEGNKQLDIKESFYKGEIRNAKELKEEYLFWIKEDATFNIVGKESIKIALECGVIDKKSIMEISEIPYAMIFL